MTRADAPRRTDPGVLVGTPSIDVAELVHQVPAIVYIDVLDPTVAVGHRTIFLSRGIETVLGYRPEEILADPDQWLRIVHPEDISSMVSRTVGHLTTPSTLSSEYRVIHRDGRILHVRDDCVSRHDERLGIVVSRGVITDVTALHEAEDRLHGFLERLPIVAYTESPVSSEAFLYVSPHIEELTGHGADAFYEDDRLFDRLVHPDDRDRQLAGYGEPGVPYRSEYRIRHRDGRTVWVRDHAITEVDAGGAPVAIHGFLFDITVEREATIALGDAGARYRSLVESLPLVTYVSDVEPTETGAWRAHYISPQIEPLLGYPAETFVSDPDAWGRVMHPDDIDTSFGPWLADPYAPYDEEYRMIAADGHVVWVRDRAITVPASDGGPARHQGFIVDITAAKSAQEALAAAEERYRSLVEGLPLVTYVDRLDAPAGRYFPSVYISPQVEDLLGMPARAFMEDHDLWARMVHPDDVDKAFTPYVPSDGGEDVLEYRMIRADGETIWVRDGSRVVEDPTGGPAVVQGYVLDVSTAKRAEEAVVRAQKLESLGNLAGGIAHDFNNLLVAMLGNAELALLDLPPESEARDAIEQVEVAARRAAELARQMLAYSGRGQFVIQPVSVNELVMEIVDLLKVAIGKGVGLTLRLGEDVPTVDADATQLRQVVMNIVVNASDAIGTRDGSITIETGLTALDAAAIARLHTTADLDPGPFVTIEVVDTGPGMDAATLGRIFDPFFTTKFAGRGLGLAAVIGIVSGHRGGVAVESRPGRGSRFTIHLPPGVAGAHETIRRPPEPNPQARGTVLVVDDEPAVRSVARRMLERTGWSVEECENGADAVERVSAVERPIDVVLLDLTMPVLDGEGAFLRIHELRPEVPIVLMSGYTETDAIHRFGDRGLAGFVQKPFTPTELTRALREAATRANGSRTTAS